MADSLGARISEMRKRKGITQDQLAEVMGVSSQAVSKWENDISCPDITALPQLADYFNITVDELLRGSSALAPRVLPMEERKDFNRMLLKVVVNETKGDRVKVSLPLSLVKVGLEIGMQMPQIAGKVNLKDIDFESILRAAESGVIGKMVEVDTSEGDHIEVTIE